MQSSFKVPVHFCSQAAVTAKQRMAGRDGDEQLLLGALRFLYLVLTGEEGKGEDGRGELLLGVVGMLLGGLLRVAGVALPGLWGRWVASLSWRRLVGHVGHVGHVVVRVGGVAHGHVPARRSQSQQTMSTNFTYFFVFVLIN